MLVYVCVCRHRVVCLLLATAMDLPSQHNVCDPTISIENFGTEIRFVVTMLFTTLNLVGLATESAFFDYALTTGLTCIIFACACYTICCICIKISRAYGNGACVCVYQKISTLASSRYRCINGWQNIEIGNRKT